MIERNCGGAVPAPGALTDADAALLAAARALPGGAVDDALAAARAELAESGVEAEYLEARDAEDLSPIESFNGRPALIAVAARVGDTRLIDNVVVEPAAPQPERQERR